MSSVIISLALFTLAIRLFLFTLLKWLIAILFIGILTFGAWMVWFASQPLKLQQIPYGVKIEPGMNMRQISRQLAEAGMVMQPWQFTLLARGLDKASRIKAGNYEITSEVTPLQLLEKLTRGDVSQAEIVFIEGWTFRQLRAALDANPSLGHDTQKLKDTEILQRIGAKEAHAEGLFFPDTYLFAKDSSDLDVLRRAYRNMQQVIEREWSKRGAKSPYANTYEALIMASIIEKETGTSADRAIIASVFVNRLRKGLLLQTDPSVIYGLGENFDGNLRKRDLQNDTPYNTYTRSGLPPTPIALPGLASIQAALKPAQTDYLYFVARGDGSSEFSRSLDAHNRAVNKFQRGR